MLYLSRKGLQNLLCVTGCLVFLISTARCQDDVEVCYQTYLAPDRAKTIEGLTANCSTGYKTAYENLVKEITEANMKTFVRERLNKNICLLGELEVACGGGTQGIAGRINSLAKTCTTLISTYGQQPENYPQVCEPDLEQEKDKLNKLMGLTCLRTTTALDGDTDFSSCTKSVIKSKDLDNIKTLTNEELNKKLLCSNERFDSCIGRASIATVCEQEIAFSYAQTIKNYVQCDSEINVMSTVKTVSTTTQAVPTVPAERNERKTGVTESDAVTLVMPTFALYFALVSGGLVITRF